MVARLTGGQEVAGSSPVAPNPDNSGDFAGCLWKDFKAALEDFDAALTYPENIGVGRSNKPQETPAQYWRGRALEALGRLEDARSAWKEGAAGHEGSREQNKYRELCRKALLTHKWLL